MSAPPSQQTITALREWVPGKLFSLVCTRPAGFRFTAGQFARLGVNNTLNLPQESPIIWRAYSMVSAPYHEHLEFFSIVAEGGAFTTHLCQLKVGDPLWLDPTAHGFLTTARFESGRDLWLLASGTGLAPFVSMIYDLHTWEQFERVVLVHCVRMGEELAYQDVLLNLPVHPELSVLVPNLAQRFTYIPVVTRQAWPGALLQRITHLVDNGQLEHLANTPFSKAHSRFMLCGNPQMVQDLRQVLKQKGFSPARRNAPGEVAVENYW